MTNKTRQNIAWHFNLSLQKVENSMNPYDETFIEELRKSLPPTFTRETVCKLLGGIFSPRTLSNFDAAGNGPRRKYHIGRKVAYIKEDFIDWLSGMLNGGVKNVGKRKNNWCW